MAIKMKPTSVIRAQLGINPNGRVQAYFTERCTNYMDKYVPKGDTGHLSSVKTMDTNSVTYEVPYAHFQYIGKLYIDPLTRSSWARKGTKKVPTNIDLVQNGYPYWDKKMWSIHKQDIIKEVQKYVDRGGK